MNHLSTLTATRHEFGCDPGYAGIDLFLHDGGYITLQTELEVARRVLSKTHCDLVRLVVDDQPMIALFSGWPHAWHAFRLALNEVQPEEIVRLNTCIALGEAPDRFVHGTAALFKVDPWVRVQGPACLAATPLTAKFSNSGESELCAGSLRLPPGVRLVSPPDRVLFRLESEIASREGVLLV